MKKIFSFILSIVMVITAFAPISAFAQAPTPSVRYDFDTTSSVGKLQGNAKIVKDSSRGNVLYLDGTDGTYAQLQDGIFDGKDEMTINMDVKSLLNDGNFFTFAFGVDNQKYAFLRVRGYETCFIMARNGNAEENYAGGLKARTGKWHTITMVINNGATALYVNGVKVTDGQNNGANITVSEYGKGLKAYLGKSFYEGDRYFKGYYDNIEIYDKALNDSEVLESVEDRVPFISSAIIGTTVDKASKGTDNHTSAGAIIDDEAKTITPYVKKGANLKALPMQINCVNKECMLYVNGNAFKNGDSIDLTSDKTLSVSYKGVTQKYLIKKATIAYNSCLPGQYADPDIDYFDGKYWMFPTTDGYDWWSGKEFHAFSSTDLDNWTDEGVILRVGKEYDENGDEINPDVPLCPWSNTNAWAPTIEKKNGKYYFYFCGNYVKTNRMAIGVAVADSPAGPYTIMDTPLIHDDVPEPDNDNKTPLYVNTDDVRVNRYTTFRGQTIDPSIFTDDDGTSYILFGNGTPALFKLNDDMMSVDETSYKRINQGNGLENFCESVYCIKRNGVYHFTWSCNGTDDERYMVGYGTATTLTGKVDYRGILMKENEEIGALCTAHQSLVYRKDLDKCILAYHRFYTPLGIYTDQYGKHRETCIEEVKFDSDGFMKTVTPSMYGVRKIVSSLTATLSTTSYTYNGVAKKPSVTVKDSAGNVLSKDDYAVSYANNINAGTGVVTIKVNCKYSGTITKKFTIKPQDASKFSSTLSTTSYTYDGKAKKPSVTVKNSSGTKISSANYTVSYTANTNVGKATATITFKGNYAGTIKKSYTILPKGTSLATITPISKGFTAKWTKQTKQITGYQLQYSTSSKFTSPKTVTIASPTTISKKVTKLTAKKKYYIRIRTYKKVGATTYYSKWSASKYVTTKK